MSGLLESAAPRPMDDGTRRFMEARFGQDFADVRLHTDGRAATAAEAQGADAYTLGHNIVFGPGRYQPGTESGRRLLAHELAHVVQQTRAYGAAAGNSLLEAEAHAAAEEVVEHRKVRVQPAAPATQPQRQPKGTAPQWKAGDVELNADAVQDFKVGGALFSGADQAHVNVSTRGRLAYDTNHTTPEDPFRWDKLKEIIDSGHLRIKAVSSSQNFKASPGAGGPTFDISIDEIKLRVNDLSVDGVTLVRESVELGIRATELAAAAPPPAAGGRAAPGAESDAPTTPGGTGARGGTGTAAPAPTPASGLFSADRAHDEIYYDKNAAKTLGHSPLAHELFGHYWLSLKGVPFTHPPTPAAERLMGTLAPRHGILDPFGQTFSGTVREYIARFIESTSFEARQLPGGATIQAPVSRTQGVSQTQFRDALAGFIIEARTGLGKKTTPTGSQTLFTAKLAQQLRLVSNNFDALTDKKDRQLVVDFLADKWFKNRLTADQQDAFRDMLDQFKTRKGWSNPLADELLNKVGPSKASQIFQAPAALPSPGGLQLSNP